MSFVNKELHSATKSENQYIIKISVLVAHEPKLTVNPNPQEDEWSMKNCSVLHFGCSNLGNSANYVLDQYRTLMGNCFWQVE